ncbi:MAG: peptidyl-prolyl cis-trans isomerase [Spirochaetes bacterium]|nr:peptidyl-prolyl cis-trans isomerase [Spirochaetota bacterium]
MRTNMGDVVIELFDDRAPATVRNFLAYADRGFYSGTVFHRVIGNFMIQGGGMMPGLVQKATAAPIANEAHNGIANNRGTLAMARTMDPHSATAQFFINVENNDFLNFRDRSVQGYGYCVFGRVLRGMEVVDRIRRVPTHTAGPYQDVPVRDVVILSITRQ